MNRIGMANKLYDAYCRHTDWKSLVSGAKLPYFRDLPEDIKEAWCAVSDASHNTYKRCWCNPEVVDLNGGNLIIHRYE